MWITPMTKADQTRDPQQDPENGDHFDSTHGVSRAERLDDLEECLSLIYKAPPYDIPKRAYVELVLVVGACLQDCDDNRIKAGKLYEPLSSYAEKAVRENGGVTNVTSVPHVLQITPGKRKQGSRGFYKLPTTYGLGGVVLEAMDIWGELDAEAEELAEAIDQVEGNGEDDLRTQLSVMGLCDQSSPEASGPSPETSPDQGSPREDQDPAGPADGPRPRALDGTNGGTQTPQQSPENRRSERSDREIEVDESQGTPPSEKDFRSVGTRAQREFLDVRVRSCAERLFFLDLVDETRKVGYGAGEEEDWTVVGRDQIRSRYGVRGATYVVWEGSKLIEVYKDGAYLPPEVVDGEKGKARKFRVPEEVLSKWTELGAGGSRRWRLDTESVQRTTQPAPMKTLVQDDNGRNYPELVDGALRVLRDANHKINLEVIEKAEQVLARREGRKVRHQLSQLQMARETIERQTVDRLETEAAEMAVIQNAYEVQRLSGRISFKKGGPQGLMGEVKAKAYSHYTNYDIRSCHTEALKQVADWLEELGVEIDTSPLEEYPGKYVVAENLGLPPILIKITEHAVKYGAFLPASVAHADTIAGQTGHRPELADASERYAECPNEALSKLRDRFSPIRAVVKEISCALLNEYYDEHACGGWMHNRCGISFCPSNWEEGHKRESKVMAWTLQGLEAAFVHSITILSQEYDYEVVANEHDGAIVDGRVPQEAIEQAREMSGFVRAEFVEKPFADANEVEQIYDLSDGTEVSENGDTTQREDRKPTPPSPTDTLARKRRDRRKRVQKGDIPLRWPEAKKQGFSLRGWSRAQTSPMN